MKRVVLCAAVTAVMTVPSLAAAQTAAQADHAFMQALAKSDTAGVAPLLDADLIWTNAEGQTHDKAAVLAHLPSIALSDADSKSYTYGKVVTVRTDSGKLHVLRVWTQRPAGWRLLVYHEVKQAEPSATPSAPAPPVKECINPCQKVPYEPRNDAEAGVIKAWQQLETAVTAGDSQTWARHFADEFVVISSSGTEPVTKQGRMAALDRQKQAGTNGAPAGLAPDRTRMFTIGDTVVMNCEAVPHRGKPAHITRVWIKRNGAWLMTVSFQTTIQAAAAVAGN